MSDASPLPQGSTIGILGGGQLGRMLALAAARLGMKTHIYCPDPDSPAFDVTPLKTVEPFIVRVDNSTGIVDVVSALASTAGTYDEAVTKYFAAKYVRAREGYVWSEAQENFRSIALLSTQAEQARFSAIYRGSNPESPQNIYGRAATARINIASISLINQNVVSVRYMRTITRGEETRTSHWVATLTYSYANAPMSSTDRLVNPLGFAVSEYRADPEAIN